MPKTYSHTVDVEIMVAGNALTFKADVEYTCQPGYPGSGPSLSDPGDPPEPAELEVDRVTLLIPDTMAIVPTGTERPTKETDAPEWLFDFIATDGDMYRELGEACDWGVNGPDPDYEYERSRDDGVDFPFAENH